MAVRTEESVKHPAQSIRAFLRVSGPEGAADSPVFACRALCHLELKQYQEVVKDCTEALRLDGKNVKAFYRRAQAYKALKVKRSCPEAPKSHNQLCPWWHFQSMVQVRWGLPRPSLSRGPRCS